MCNSMAERLACIIHNKRENSGFLKTVLYQVILKHKNNGIYCGHNVHNAIMECVKHLTICDIHHFSNESKVQLFL